MVTATYINFNVLLGNDDNAKLGANAITILDKNNEPHIYIHSLLSLPAP